MEKNFGDEDKSLKGKRESTERERASYMEYRC